MILVILFTVPLVSSTIADTSGSALPHRDLRRVCNHILVLDHHVFGRVYLVVEDYDFSFHKLETNIAYRTRVISQSEVDIVVGGFRPNCREI